MLDRILIIGLTAYWRAIGDSFGRSSFCLSAVTGAGQWGNRAGGTPVSGHCSISSITLPEAVPSSRRSL